MANERTSPCNVMCPHDASLFLYWCMQSITFLGAETSNSFAISYNCFKHYLFLFLAVQKNRFALEHSKQSLPSFRAASDKILTSKENSEKSFGFSNNSCNSLFKKKSDFAIANESTFQNSELPSTLVPAARSSAIHGSDSNSSRNTFSTRCSTNRTVLGNTQ